MTEIQSNTWTETSTIYCVQLIWTGIRIVCIIRSIVKSYSLAQVNFVGAINSQISLRDISHGPVCLKCAPRASPEILE